MSVLSANIINHIGLVLDAIQKEPDRCFWCVKGGLSWDARP